MRTFVDDLGGERNGFNFVVVVLVTGCLNFVSIARSITSHNPIQNDLL